jgi:hypothetical protein
MVGSALRPSHASGPMVCRVRRARPALPPPPSPAALAAQSLISAGYSALAHPQWPGQAAFKLTSRYRDSDTLPQWQECALLGRGLPDCVESQTVQVY